jgi:protein-disulfide isomerase
MKRFGMKRSLRLAAPLTALGLGAMALTALAAPARPRPAGAAATNWLNVVEERDSGHVLGNPQAERRLVEFVSYTCSHCAEFARTGEQAIKLAVVPRGRASFEIRHLLRDPIDLTATLLTHCGASRNFPRNHQAILLRQSEWMAKERAISQAQRTRWNFGTNIARRRAIASDLGFYDIMEDQGYNRAQIDRCLADEAKARQLAETTQRDVAALGLQGTPSFVLDGKLLDGVHGWEALRPVLEKLD